MLCDVNAFSTYGVKRLKKEGIPPRYTITDADIAGLLPTGETISSQIEAGRLFIIDGSILDGIPCGFHPQTKVFTICYNIVCQFAYLIFFRK